MVQYGQLLEGKEEMVSSKEGMENRAEKNRKIHILSFISGIMSLY